MQLSTNTRFLNDKNEFTARISKMPAGDDKNKAQQLLNRLIAEVQEIDRFHENLVTASTRPKGGVEDTRSQIASIRQQLDKMTEKFKS